MTRAVAFCGYMSVASLTAAVILVLARYMPAWFAALVVSLVYGVAAAIMAIDSKSRADRKRGVKKPREVETVKEELDWRRQSTKP